MVINTTFRLALWADVLYACDHPWWDLYFPELATNFRGELWTVSEGARDRYGLRWILGHKRANGLATSTDHINTGLNSGYQTIGLAYLFGAARIILLGFDYMVGAHGERHWHGNHPQKLGNGGVHMHGQWINAMNQLAADLAMTECKVLNASRRTALKCYPRLTLETALHENTRHPDGR